MNLQIQDYIAALNLGPSPPKDDIDRLICNLSFPLDQDFVDFLSEHNGADGFLTRDYYILLWSIKEMLELNPYYPESKACEKLFFFGSDGSNFGFAFDKTNGEVVGIDFLEIEQTKPKKLGNSFSEFLKILKTKSDS